MRLRLNWEGGIEEFLLSFSQPNSSKTLIEMLIANSCTSTLGNKSIRESSSFVFWILAFLGPLMRFRFAAASTGWALHRILGETERVTLVRRLVVTHSARNERKLGMTRSLSWNINRRSLSEGCAIGVADLPSYSACSKPWTDSMTHTSEVAGTILVKQLNDRNLLNRKTRLTQNRWYAWDRCEIGICIASPS